MPRNCSGHETRVETSIPRPLSDPTRGPRSGHSNLRPHALPQEEEPHSAPRPLRGAEHGADVTSPRGGREIRRVAARDPRRKLSSSLSGNGLLLASAGFLTEIGPSSPTAQDSQATSPRGDASPSGRLGFIWGVKEVKEAPEPDFLWGQESLEFGYHIFVFITTPRQKVGQRPMRPPPQISERERVPEPLSSAVH